MKSMNVSTKIFNLKYQYVPTKYNLLLEITIVVLLLLSVILDTRKLHYCKTLFDLEFKNK